MKNVKKYFIKIKILENLNFIVVKNVKKTRKLYEFKAQVIIMDRKDFRPNETTSSSNNTSKQYDLRPENDSRKSFYGKAKVRTENGKLILRSYDTDVAYIENGHAVVINTQSPTTVIHVKEFLKQNGYKADTKAQIERDYTEYRAKDFDSLKFPSGKASALTHSEQLDYDDYVEYSNANNKYVKVKNGYGNYEYIKYSEIVNKDGSSKKPIERNVIGYPTLYSKGGQKAYGFNKQNFKEEIREEKHASKEYKELAKKNPKDKKVYNELSKDESTHARELKKLEKKESKSEIRKPEYDKRYYGVMTEEFDKSASLLETDADYKPRHETAGWTAHALWSETREGRDKDIDYVKKIGYKLEEDIKSKDK